MWVEDSSIGKEHIITGIIIYIWKMRIGIVTIERNVNYLKSRILIHAT